MPLYPDWINAEIQSFDWLQFCRVNVKLLNGIKFSVSTPKLMSKWLKFSTLSSNAGLTIRD